METRSRSVETMLDCETSAAAARLGEEPSFFGFFGCLQHEPSLGMIVMSSANGTMSSL